MTDLDARYGRRPPLSRGARVLVGCAVAAVIGIAVLVIWSWAEDATPDVDARLVSYDVVSDSAVEARMDVAKPADRSVVCDVVAKNEDTEIVGRSSVTVPAGQSAVRVDTTVETTERAVLAAVDGCRLG